MVVVHFGPLDPTLRTVESALEYCEAVVVIANDGARRPAAISSRVRWIVPVRNLGFGQAINEAAASLAAKFFLLLNTDTEVSVSCVDGCCELFQSPDVGIVAPRLNFSDGRLQSGPGKTSRLLSIPSARGGEHLEAATDCAWVSGAVMFVRASVLSQVQFDGSYFLGHEDVDFCLRARALGWRVVWNPLSPAVHHQGQVVGNQMWHYYCSRNAIWFARDSKGNLWALAAYMRLLGQASRVWVADILKRRGTAASKAAWAGIRDGRLPKPNRTAGPREDEPRWVV